MTKQVLVLGATGFIGLPVARAFLRRGYLVYGLARSEEKAKLLQQNGIVPVLGDAKNFESWRKVAEESQVIVEAVADYTDYSAPQTILQGIQQLYKTNPQLRYIYTSGVWVLGTSTDVELTEEKVNPLPIVAWRPALEQAVVALGGTVLRPGILYGTTGSLTHDIFAGAKAGKVVVGPKQFSHFVHQDDLAEGYALAAENEKAKGEIFNLGGHPTDFLASLQNLQKVVEFTIEEAEGTNPFEIAVRNSVRVSDRKAKEVLGWTPKVLPFEQHIDLYFNTWSSLSK